MKFILLLTFMVGLFMSDIVAVLSELRQDEISSRGKRSAESASYFFYQQPEYPRDCKEVYDQCEGESASGVYLIKPEGSPEPFEVFCNNSIDGGGWTVFQRRMDGSVDFYRYWNDYKMGFGFLRGDFWLGNDKVSYLTNQKHYELRIDLNNVNGEPYFTKYTLFCVSDEGTKYRLVGLGDVDPSSTASHNPVAFNASFGTRDRDNDPWTSGNCATYRHGGWWYGYHDGNYCSYSGLNNLYTAGSTDYKSIRWYNLPGGQYHIKYTEMKIRPVAES